MFIDHRQEQWSDWLGMAKFAYNNKAHSSTKVLPFKANYRQDPRMGFKMRRKGKYKGAEKFVTKIKEIQKEAKAALGKAQEKIVITQPKQLSHYLFSFPFISFN